MKLSKPTLCDTHNGCVRLVTMVALATILFFGPSAAGADSSDDSVSINVETEGSYTLGPGDSRPLAHKFAVFRAQRNAAEQVADRFSQQRLIQFVDRDKKELIALVADVLRSKQLWEHWQTKGATTVYTIRLSATVNLSDFIDAQLTSIRLAHQVDSQGYRDEMEPLLPESLKPGQALAKAYWLLHEHELRRAIIYLDRLTCQYPNWMEAYEIKAAALGFQNQFTAMQEALQRACELGSTTACTEENQNGTIRSLK
jgi:hypothetical protein